jgi:hypothetical protein
MLQKALRKAGSALRLSSTWQVRNAMFRHACAMRLEGIVSADEPLQVGRVLALGEGQEPGI